MRARRLCFVIMPIGDQRLDDVIVTSAELRRRYDDLIKEALLKAAPDLEVVRADDVAAPGTITSDILTRLMGSDLVVADVSFPNPNVFYELGLRHACRVGTAIIRDKNAPKVPFDIAHLRHIEYENSPTGLKKLAIDFASFLEFHNRNPTRPDNGFQELAKLTRFQFPNYAESEADDPETEAMMAIMQTPEVLDLLVQYASGKQFTQSDIAAAILKNPQIAGLLTKALIETGRLSLSGNRDLGDENSRAHGRVHGDPAKRRRRGR